jgi:hypothetical protein
MNRVKRVINSFLIFSILVLLSGTGCASIKRNRVLKSTRTDSCDLSEMGKNRYFHTKHYKKRVSHSSNKIKHKASRKYFFN